MVSLVKYRILIHFEFISHSDLSVDLFSSWIKMKGEEYQVYPPCGSQLTLNCKYLLLTIVLILGLRLWQE